MVRIIRSPQLLDLLLAVLLTTLTVATLWEQGLLRFGPAAVVVAMLSVAPVAVRQKVPMASLLVIAAAVAAWGLAGWGDLPGNGIGLVIMMFTVATIRGRWMGVVTFVVGLAALAVSYSTASSEILWSQAVQSVVVFVVVWMVGEGTRRWAHRAELLAAGSARAVAEERGRIARELHDIVAHHMAVISLQAGVADYVLDTDPREARKSIQTVGETSRDALVELRRLVRVLRIADVGYQPQPGLGQLDDLLSKVRDAGLSVRTTTKGTVRALSAGVDLCAYRMVQESLTNVLRHAGNTASVHVELSYGQEVMTIRVTDNGKGVVTGSEPPAGHGLRGMRERAELFGGVLRAGPATDGGFEVLLRLPLAEAS